MYYTESTELVRHFTLSSHVQLLMRCEWTLLFAGQDDVVLIFSRNHVDYPVCIWAVHRLGGIVS